MSASGDGAKAYAREREARKKRRELKLREIAKSTVGATNMTPEQLLAAERQRKADFLQREFIRRLGDAA